MEIQTPQQALSILDQATTPKNIAGLNRADFVAIERSLQVLHEFITANQPKPAEPSKAP